MKQRLLSLLLNQYMIALLISMLVVYFLPDYFSKYKVEMVSKDWSNGINNLIYYEDLNGDQQSEQIIAQTEDFGNASFLLYKSNGDLIDQYNFKKPFAGKHKYLWFQDADGDGFNEIYFVTQSKDSLFLNSSEPFGDGKMYRENMFIDKVVPFNDSYDVSIDFCNVFSKIKSDKKEVIFSLNTGFSCYPRFAYKYDYKTNTILKSEHLSNPSSISQRFNLDDDAKNEYVIINSSAANDNVSKFTTKSDYSTWLTVLDDDLSLLFEPIEFPVIGSIKSVGIFIDKSPKLITLLTSRQPEKIPSKLMMVSTEGIIEKEISVPIKNINNLFLTDDNEIVIHDMVTGEIMFFTPYLKLIASNQIIPEIAYLDYYDVNNDSFKEWIGIHRDNKYVSLYRKDFNHEVTFQISDIEDASILNLGIKKISQNKWQMYFQRGQTNSIFSYGQNPLYVFRYGIYLGVYGVILGLVWLIIKGQKIREAKQRAIENEISELQIKTVKNQVDPHFVFNAINTISEMTLAENKIEADNFICRFSDFMRQTLQSSDKISTTLNEELEYTENFIKLQQIRYNQQFEYDIQVDKDVNLKTTIPKHVLFTYVENAIKHGLANSSKKGLIKIAASNKKNGLLLSVEDNGKGINPVKEPKQNSTGNGLLIMEKIYGLYSNLTNKKINHNIVELCNKSNEKAGLRVEILISKT
ncbi:sensor histidine kinase [Yeosuana sp. AK3]